MPTVLSVSRDHLLLKTREHVLRTAGYEVVSSETFREAVASLQQSELPDLLLLGHTLSEDEKDELERQLRKISQTTPIVELTTDLYENGISHKNYFRMSFGDPAQLISVCRFALGQRRIPAALHAAS